MTEKKLEDRCKGSLSVKDKQGNILVACLKQGECEHKTNYTRLAQSTAAGESYGVIAQFGSFYLCMKNRGK